MLNFSKNKVTSFLDNHKVHFIVYALITGITIFLFIQSIGCAIRPIGYDFTSYLMSAKALINGTDPYNNGTVFPYVYPLTLAFSIIPLAVLPYWLAITLWFIITAACLLGVFLILIKIFRNYGYPINLKKPPFIILVFYLIFLEILQNNFRNGQVNIQVLLLCVLFFYFYDCNKKLLASIFLALAIAFKLVPGLFVIFLLFRKDYKTLITTSLLTVAFFLVPIIFTGTKIFEYYVTWFNNFIFHDLEHQTSSPEAFLNYNLSDTLLIYLNLSMKTARPLAFCIVLCSLGLVEILSFKSAAKVKVICIFSLYLLGILLLSPRSQTHYMIYLFPCLFSSFTLLIYEQRKGIKALFIGFIAIFIFLLIAQYFKHGPWYFLAILDSFILTTYLLYSQIRKASNIS